MSATTVDRFALTGQQRAAVTAQGVSVALGAGAGCGKTSVLTERYLALLDAAPRRPLGKFVALTFTEKAARELRDRVRQACRLRLAEGRDVAHWRSILRGLEAAPIGTFHSFCARILRRYAVQAGVDPGFVILDEAIAPTLRDDTLSACIREWLAARNPDFIELAIEFGLYRVREALSQLLASHGADDLEAWAGRDPDEVVAIWKTYWEDKGRALVLQSYVDKALPCLDLLEMHPCQHPKMRERQLFLLENVPRLPTCHDALGLLEEIKAEARVQGGGTKVHWPSEAIFEAVKKGLTKLRESVKGVIEELNWDEADELTSRSAAEHGLQFARLAVEAARSFDRVKRGRGFLDYDDLQRNTRNLLAEHAGAVCQDLAHAIDVLLVDEFQDTDPIQGEILERLAGEPFGAGRLFLVGDDKQSIYRFRGARPQIFFDFRRQFPAEGQLTLNENFRSLPGIIDFVNALFADTFPGADHSLKPGPRTPERDGQPAVEFLWACEPTDGNAKVIAADRRAVEARWIARHLARRLAEGWMVRDRDSGLMRKAHPGDITLLFRSLNDAAYYEQALVAEQLEYYVVGGSAFFAQQEVQDLVNLLSALEDPLDAVSLAGALRSPFFAVSDEALYWLATSLPGGLTAGFDGWGQIEPLSRPDRERLARAYALLTRWRAVKDRLPIASLVDLVLDESGYEAALLGEFLGSRKRANVRKLVRLSRRFDLQGGFTLADFVARLRADLKNPPKEEQAATTDEEGESVRLMTIHQAKGLEFPIVVLPDLDRGQPRGWAQVAFHAELGPLVRLSSDDAVTSSPEGPTGQGATDHSLGWSIYDHLERREDAAEALRVFYVATTRARDVLVLSSGLAADADPKSHALRLLARRFDLRSGLLKKPLPEGLVEPVVRVVSEPPPSPESITKPRPRLRLVKVARLISKATPEDELAQPAPLQARPPRLVDLDPARGMPPVAARIDRLIRSILADPRALKPGGPSAAAERAARQQDPAAPPSIVRAALERLTPWLEGPMARSIMRAAEVRRAIPWTIAFPIEHPEPTVFQGQIDFAFRARGGRWQLANLASAEAKATGERLRLLLSAHAASDLGIDPMGQGWSVRLGLEGGLIGEEQFGSVDVEQAIRAYLGPTYEARRSEPEDQGGEDFTTEINEGTERSGNGSIVPILPQ